MYEYEFDSRDMIKMLKEIKEFIDEKIDELKDKIPSHLFVKSSFETGNAVNSLNLFIVSLEFL